VSTLLRVNAALPFAAELFRYTLRLLGFEEVGGHARHFDRPTPAPGIASRFTAASPTHRGARERLQGSLAGPQGSVVVPRTGRVSWVLCRAPGTQDRALRGVVLVGVGSVVVGGRSCNQALKPTQGVSVISYLVLPRYLSET
jgi:hypothetical protein